VASFVGTLNLVIAAVVDAGAGRLSLEGQEIRTSKVITDVPADRLVTLAVRPEGIALGEGGGSNHLRGEVDDINFLGSIVRIRIKIGDGADGQAPTAVSLDAFNEPHLKLPAVGETVTISFPPEACFVLGAARDGAAASTEAGAEV